MAFNPDAVFVSPSSLADLDKCPQLYYYRNVYRTTRGMKLQLTNPSLSLGQTVHDVIAQFTALDSPQRTHTELDRIVVNLWDKVRGDKGGFSGPEEENEFRGRADAMISRFWSNEHFHTAVCAKIPSFPKVDLGPNLILTGKLDWIEAMPGGGYEILDFKTGKNKEKEDSLQLPIYAILVNSIFKTRNLKAKYWYLDTDEPMEEVELPDIDEATKTVSQKAQVCQMVRLTNSFNCQSGQEQCWACRDMKAIADGKGKLVSIDMARKQEIYILPKEKPQSGAEKVVQTVVSGSSIPVADDLPF